MPTDPTTTAARLDTCDHKECLSSDRCLYGNNAGPTAPATAATERATRYARLAHRLRRMTAGPGGIVLHPPMNAVWRRLRKEENGW